MKTSVQRTRRPLAARFAFRGPPAHVPAQVFSSEPGP
jgi:hypothetical protein